MAAPERVTQGIHIHDLAAREVEQVAARAHAGELRGANHGEGAGRFRHVERHEIRVLEHPVEVGHRTGQAERQFPDDVVEQHPHAEGLGEQPHLLADVAVADEAHGAAAHLVRAGERLVPMAPVQRGALVAEPPGQRDHGAEREFGHAAGRGVGGIEHRNAAPGRVANRDLVGAHREAAEREHPAGVLQMFVAHLGARPHAEHVRGGHHLGKLLAFQGSRDDRHGVAVLGERFGGGRVDVFKQRDANPVAGIRGLGHSRARTAEPYGCGASPLCILAQRPEAPRRAGWSYGWIVAVLM